MYTVFVGNVVISIDSTFLGSKFAVYFLSPVLPFSIVTVSSGSSSFPSVQPLNI